MKKFKVETKQGVEVVFDFPNSISEIPEDYLAKITSGISVADNYSLVALVYFEKLSKIIITARTNKKDTKLSVTPIFVKAGNTDVEFIKNAKMKQRLISTPTQIGLATHVKLPGHKLNLEYFANTVCDSASNKVYETELANEDQRPCCFLEFKLVPNCDIMGFIDTDNKVNDDCVTVISAEKPRG